MFYDDSFYQTLGLMMAIQTDDLEQQGHDALTVMEHELIPDDS